MQQTRVQQYVFMLTEMYHGVMFMEYDHINKEKYKWKSIHTKGGYLTWNFNIRISQKYYIPVIKKTGILFSTFFNSWNI